MPMSLLTDKEDELTRLERLSVKELRRVAAIKNVPLTCIAQAVEKSDLINMIIKAGPVLDTYDVNLGVKVHSAQSIASMTKEDRERAKKEAKLQAKKLKKNILSLKDKKRDSSSSSSSEGRKKSDKHRKRSRSRKRKKSRSRSTDLMIVLPTGTEPVRRKKAKPAPEPVVSKALPLDNKPAQPADCVILDEDDDVVEVVQPATEKALVSIPSAPPPLEGPAAEARKAVQKGPKLAQAGMVAAAALGFNVLPKAPNPVPLAPAAGLRPTINSAAPAPYGAALAPGGRVCIAYLINANCQLGNNCPEAHIIDPEEEMRVRAKFKEQPCNYGENCTRTGCLFRHPGERLEEMAYIAEGQGIALRPTSSGMALTFM